MILSFVISNMYKIIILISLFAFAFCSKIYPDELTVEYLVSPGAVDSPNPRLAWILKPVLNADKTVPRNVTQTAYQVLVASTSERLNSGKPDLWDSNKVKSDRTFNVRYQGIKLLPGQKVFWTVRVWDQDDKVSDDAKITYWQNALNESQWTAKWIGAPTGLQKKAIVNLRAEDQQIINNHTALKPVLYFRKHFLIDNKNIKQAKLYATARGLYKVYFNGPVEMSTNQDTPVLNPGWTDYTKLIQYQVYEVTKHIENENITIGAMVGTGWYSGYVGYLKGHNYYGDDEFLLLELHVIYQNDSKIVISSDESWKVTTGPQIYSDLLQGELFYEDRTLYRWMESDYNDISWSPVVTENLNKSVELIAEASLPLSEMNYLDVKDSWQLPSGSKVYDFGINFVGYVAISLHNNDKNFTATVIHGEMLSPDDTVYTANLRAARSIETYVCNDGHRRSARLTLKPHFTYHGFRYIEISGLPDNVLNDSIKGVRIGMKDMIRSTFHTDNVMVNQLHGNIVRGQLSNLISIPTDCSQRDERLGWMGDAEMFAPTAIYNGDLAGFYTKWMRDIREAQSSNGAFSLISPRLVILGDGGAVWGDAGVILTWLMYQMYGDIQIVNENYHAMTSWLSYIQLNNPTLIWRNKMGDFGDWLNVNAITPSDVIGTAYFAYDASLLSSMAKILGKTSDAEKYSQLFTDIAKAFNREFVDKTNGKIRGNTQTCYILALYFGLLSDELIPKAVQLLVDNIKDHNMHLTTGFVGTQFLLPVLTMYGHSDIAYKLLLQDTYPSWGFTIKNNATTIWERWDGWSAEAGFQDPSMNSFNNYPFGSVGRWMFQFMAGIDTDLTDLAFKKIIIKPHIGNGINQMNASYKSIRGRIHSSWRIVQNNVTLQISIPPNTKATVTLPFLKEKWVKEVDSGDYEFTVQLS